MADAPGHRLAVRVYFEDTDAGGIVYHTAYLRFAERGRTEFLRSLGFEHRALRRETGAGFAVARCEVDYLRPALLDDILEVETRLLEAGGASARMEQTVRRGSEVVARMAVRLAFLGEAGRPARVPGPLRRAFTGAAA